MNQLHERIFPSPPPFTSKKGCLCCTDPLIKSLRKVVLGDDHGSRPSMDIDVCSERQVQLVLDVSHFFDLLFMDCLICEVHIVVWLMY